MELRVVEANNKSCAEVISDELEIKDSQAASDLMASAYYQGCTSVIIYERNLTPDFFDLKTGLAGAIFQKYSNYNMKLAIIGEFEKYPSKSLRDLIIECNRGQQFFFVPDREAALEKLT